MMTHFGAVAFCSSYIFMLVGSFKVLSLIEITTVASVLRKCDAIAT